MCPVSWVAGMAQNEDGTLSVPMSPSGICAATKDAKDPPHCKVCTPICLVAPQPPAGAVATVSAEPKGGCINDGASDTLGWAFSALVILGGASYLVGGMACKRLWRGVRPSAAAGGWRALLPHRAVWAGLHGLCMDGVAFARERLGRPAGQRLGRREPLLSAAAASEGGRVEGGRRGSAASSSSGSKRRSKKSQKRSKKGRRAGLSSAAGEAVGSCVCAGGGGGGGALVWLSAIWRDM
jgi:hypothetical protein